ncbi:PspA/IM30 family protein [Novispirillum itersonii]|uniref:Phage shock protein A n=1 Tax=Novispirillum itersonii TaxID=189 RepID=A0A7X0DMP7_NOVIT|nr:PspA/IM30 family protein [Novispirillum itersonii]MBB6211276.1 phage shock protein A [Novispirillum itersonii]
MSLFRKLFSLGKGAVTEVAESIADSQALRILDQEIRDAETALSKARDELAALMAKRALQDRKITELKEQIAGYETKGGKALSLGQEDLAREVAERIAALEQELTAATTSADAYRTAETKMRATITQTEGRITTLKREIDTVRATEAVQKAQAAVAAKHSGVNTALGDATASLERLKARQAEQEARFSAAEELDQQKTGADLDQRLAALGIGDSGANRTDEIMARFKSKS